MPEVLIPIKREVIVPEGVRLIRQVGDYCEFAGTSAATKTDIKGAGLTSVFWEQDTGEWYHLDTTGWEICGPSDEDEE